MFENLELMDVVSAAALFGFLVAVVLIVGVLWHMRSRKRTEKVEQRLGMATSSDGVNRQLHLWLDGQRASMVVPAGPSRLTLGQRLERMRRDAGWAGSCSGLILSLVGLVVACFIVGYVLLQSLMFAAVAAAAAAAAWHAYMQWRIGRRSSLYDRQLVDALQLAARSLRAGHPLAGAFQLIAEDLDDPVKSVFSKICQQQEMGVSLQAALQQAGTDASSDDMRLFATSVSIQLRAGGNLADMMDRISFVIRERIRLSRRVNVLTAQTQFSKRILLGLPFLLFGALYLIQPDYMGTFQDTTEGMYMLGGAALSLLVGAYTMNRMAKIEY